MIDPNKYLHLNYQDCNCLDLVIKIYEEEYQVDISFLRETISVPKCFKKMKKPLEGAIIVLFSAQYRKHVGVYTRGLVLHSLDQCGVRKDSLASLCLTGWAVKSIYHLERYCQDAHSDII